MNSETCTKAYKTNGGKQSLAPAPLLFGNRYLAAAALVYILSIYFALNSDSFSKTAERVFLLYTIIFVSITAIIASVLYIIAKIHRHHETAVLIICTFSAVLVSVLGFSRVYFSNQTFDYNSTVLTSAKTITGIIADEPYLSNSGKSIGMTVDVHEAKNNYDITRFGKRTLMRVYIKKEAFTDMPNIGDSVNCEITMANNSNPAFGGAFDFNRYLRQKKIFCSVYCIKANLIPPIPPRKDIFTSLNNLGIKIRNEVIKSTRLRRYKNEESALLQGILVGSLAEMSDEQYSELKSSGFAHIAAVSGMHTSYLLAAILFLLCLIRAPKRWTGAAAIPIMIVFASAARFTPSVCRAVIMVTVFLIASMLRRRSDSITTLAIAAVILITQNPYCLESYSFLLSFGATLGILVFCNPIRLKLNPFTLKKFHKSGILRHKTEKGASKLHSFIINSISVSLSAMIGIAYFTARFFGVFQLGGILGCIIVCPLTAAAFISGFANCLINLISPKLAEIIAAVIINPTLILINRLIDFFSAKIFTLSVPQPPKSFFIVYVIICCGIYILLMPRSEKREHKL